MYENTNKQWKEMNIVVQVLKVEKESITTIIMKSWEKMQVKNLGTRTRTSESILTKRIQEMEVGILDTGDLIEEMVMSFK